jgi:hypothetical protein
MVIKSIFNFFVKIVFLSLILFLTFIVMAFIDISVENEVNKQNFQIEINKNCNKK